MAELKPCPFCGGKNELNAKENGMGKIFLLSKEEYEKYKDAIPHINICWWLRSPGYYDNYAAIVLTGGSVASHGYSVYGDGVDVRPALRLDSSSSLKTGDRIIRADFPWIVIGDGLAIAEVPIAFWRFDEKSNDYEKSEIRKKLLAWWEARAEEET